MPGESLWSGFAYTDGNGYSNSDGSSVGNAHGNGYINGSSVGNADSNGDGDGNRYCIANTEEYGHTTAASYTASSAVSLGLHAAFFGNSRSNSRVPQKP